MEKTSDLLLKELIALMTVILLTIIVVVAVVVEVCLLDAVNLKTKSPMRGDNMKLQVSSYFKIYESSSSTSCCLLDKCLDFSCSVGLPVCIKTMNAFELLKYIKFLDHWEECLFDYWLLVEESLSSVAASATSTSMIGLMHDFLKRWLDR